MMSGMKQAMQENLQKSQDFMLEMQTKQVLQSGFHFTFSGSLNGVFVDGETNPNAIVDA